MKTLITDVVGMQYRVTMHSRRLLADHVKGGPVEVHLRRDPKNTHDKNAIEVILDDTPMKGMMLGFIPRAVAAVFSPKLDAGKAEVVDAHITEVRPEDGDADLVVRWKTLDFKPKVRKKKSP